MAPSPTRPPQNPRAALTDLFAAAVAAAAPGPALRAALLERGAPDRPIWLLALGKAAEPMARAAVETLRSRGAEPAGGLLIAPAESPPPHPRLGVVAGDHPTPGPGSFAAARRLEVEVGKIPPEAEVWVLLSGGTTSLAAGPVTGVAPEDLSVLYDLLLGSGLDIAAMNRIRKRFSRWGGGKLAAALYPRPVRCFVVSDVIGDDLAAIGSGPCVPDDATATEVRATLTRAGLWQRLPPRLRNAVSEVEEGRHPETPKSGDPIFADVQSRIVASNRLALEAVAARATALGLRPVVMGGGLAGEASTVGAHLANLLLRYQQANGTQLPAVLIWGGETTVTLGDGKGGLGGRSQELALAAAQVLGEAGRDGVALLAGGTDGRDGPTDAAGGVVDETTWAAIRRRGRDPTTDLRRHDAYRALDAAGVLLKPGMTGTNVMDVVLGLVGSRESGIEDQRTTI